MPLRIRLSPMKGKLTLSRVRRPPPSMKKSGMYVELLAESVQGSQKMKHLGQSRPLGDAYSTAHIQMIGNAKVN
jgi:hypothetical protein